MKTANILLIHIVFTSVLSRCIFGSGINLTDKEMNRLFLTFLTDQSFSVEKKKKYMGAAVVVLHM